MKCLVQQMLVVLAGFAPAAMAQTPGSLVTVNAANFVSQIAPGSIASAFGSGLPADSTTGVLVCAVGNPPANCASAVVFFASSSQVNFLVPATVTANPAVVEVLHGNTVISSGTVPLTSFSPGVFTADNSGGGIFNGQAYDQNQYDLVFTTAGSGTVQPRPVSATSGDGPNILILYGTGWRNVSAANVQVNLGGVTVTPDYAGPVSGFAGLDQLNVRIPAGLAGAQNQLVDLSIAIRSASDSTTGSYAANRVEFCLSGSDASTTCPAPKPIARCSDPLPGLAAPYAPHGIFALQFPGANPVPVTRYIMNQPQVCGGNLFVVWSQVDKGNGNYDWSGVEAMIAPWAQIGKPVNFIVWGTGDSTPNTATPAYVLADPQYKSVSCVSAGNTTTLPVYFSPGYKNNYKAFITALLNRYGADPRIGYIRFGIARGGEAFPACLPELMQAAGVTTLGDFNTFWENYIVEMTAFQKSLQTTLLHSAGRVVQLMAALNQYGNPVQWAVDDFEGQNAKSLGFGFGSQGLQLSDIGAHQSGGHCSSDWCNAFNLYAGQVPLELQPIAASDPSSAPGGTGSLTVLLPFALNLKTQILEMYIQDLQVAYDPTSKDYAQYGDAYRQALDRAAAVVGYAK